MPTLTYAEQLDAMTLAVATPGKLFGAKVILSNAPVVVTRNTVVADFTPPVFTGYAPKAVTWGAPFVDVDGVVRVDGGDHTFIPTDALNPDVVYAWGLTDTAGAVLLAAQVLTVPVPLADAIHGLTIDVVVAYGD